MTTEFIEQRIIAAVRGILTEQVNAIMGEWEFVVPIIEFGKISGTYAVSPEIVISGCEQTEKERIVKTDAYSLTITFTLQEHEDGELFCYAYASAFAKALNKDVSLGGVADRAVITNRKYIPPKKVHCGEGWGLILTLRITTEEISK